MQNIHLFKYISNLMTPFPEFTKKTLAPPWGPLEF